MFHLLITEKNTNFYEKNFYYNISLEKIKNKLIISFFFTSYLFIENFSLNHNMKLSLKQSYFYNNIFSLIRLVLLLAGQVLLVLPNSSRGLILQLTSFLFNYFLYYAVLFSFILYISPLRDPLLLDFYLILIRIVYFIQITKIINSLIKI